MENFDGTRSLAILMRYTGEEKKEERQEAAKQVKGLFNRVKRQADPNQPSKDAKE